MKTEMEKCLAGEWYDCHDPFFMNLKSKAHHLLMKYNSLPYEQKTEKHAVLKEMFGSIGAMFLSVIRLYVIMDAIYISVIMSP